MVKAEAKSILGSLKRHENEIQDSLQPSCHGMATVKHPN